MGCKWVFKVKYHTSDAIERYKVNLVAKGYYQQEGHEFIETLSPTGKMVNVRYVVPHDAYFGWYILQTDVRNSFLQGDLTEDVYKVVPEGFSS